MMNSLPDVYAKRVQEIALNGEDPPATFCQSGGAIDYATLTAAGKSPIPVIDLSRLSPPVIDTSEGVQELDKLKSALSTWGCFEAIGHGISRSLLESILKVGKEFFELPMEEKKKYAKNDNDHQGYGSNPVRKGQPLNWQDRFVLNVFPEEERDLRFWPQNPPSFSEVMVEYSNKLQKVTEITSKAIARSLGLEENCFLNQFGEKQQALATYNYYPPCSKPDNILGFFVHTDASVLTVLLQDEVGLQIFNDGKWYTFPKNPDSILILNGDQMEIMSNGIFKSLVHRVLTRSDTDRLSLTTFYFPEKGKEIGPKDGLVNEQNPKLFKNVKDYIYLYFQDHGDNNAIDLVRV